MNTYEERQAKAKGENDYCMGKSINNNPYKTEDERLAYYMGWIESCNNEDFMNPLMDGTYRIVG